MAKFNIMNADEYINEGTAGLFSLKEDGQTARVRFLLTNGEDVLGIWTHWLTVGGKGRHIQCLATSKETDKEECPLCAANVKRNVKFFLPLYNVDNGETVIWERGPDFRFTFQEQLAQYDVLYEKVFEIQRKGERGNMDTKYDIIDVSKLGGYSVDVSLNDFEMPQIIGDTFLVLPRSYEELEYYVKNGHFEGDIPTVNNQRREYSNNSDNYYQARGRGDESRSYRDREDSRDNERDSYDRGGNNRYRERSEEGRRGESGRRGRF